MGYLILLHILSQQFEEYVSTQELVWHFGKILAASLCHQNYQQGWVETSQTYLYTHGIYIITVFFLHHVKNTVLYLATCNTYFFLYAHQILETSY